MTTVRTGRRRRPVPCPPWAVRAELDVQAAHVRTDVFTDRDSPTLHCPHNGPICTCSFPSPTRHMAAPKSAIRAPCPVRGIPARVGVPEPGEGSTPCRWHCLGAPGGPGTLPSCVSSAPQNPHKSGSAEWFPTESPRTKRHSPAHDGTDANMPLPPLTGLYAGSAGLTILKLPVVRAATDLLLSGRSRVRVAVGAHVICAGQAICHQPVHRAHLASVPLACQIA